MGLERTEVRVVCKSFGSEDVRGHKGAYMRTMYT
jgi:hypothetical protein